MLFKLEYLENINQLMIWLNLKQVKYEESYRNVK